MNTKCIFLRTLVILTMSSTFLSCSDNDEPKSEDNSSVKEKALQAAMIPYINNTVIPTYQGMADNAILMSEACNEMLEAF